MSVKGEDLDNVVMDPDPDKDDSGADRGDEVKEDATAEDDAAAVRDDKGRFKKKDEEEDEAAGKDKKDKKEKGKEEEEEEEEEEGEEEEEEEEEEGEEEEGKRNRDRKVPYGRFQEVVTQRNALAERLTALDAQQRTEAKDDK